MGSYRPNRRVSERCQVALEAKGCTVVDGTEIVREVRSFKSPAEMVCVEKAARIADIGLEAARETLRPGITELELWGGSPGRHGPRRRGEPGDPDAGDIGR